MRIKIGNYRKWRWFNRYLFDWFGYTPEQKVSIKIDPWDTYSMDYSLSKIILPLLIQFKEEADSHPYQLTSEEWDEILDDIIFSFSWRLNNDWYYSSEGDREKALAGFELFGKWFLHLWT